MSEHDEPCRLGYEEHDGTSYCFAHGGFANTVIRQMTCDRRPKPANIDGLVTTCPTPDEGCACDPPWMEDE